jgi:hypothetical protein
MKNLIKNLGLLALVLFCAMPALAQQGQNSIAQTTLSVAISGPAGYSGTSSTISGTVTIAACAGVAAPVLPGTPVSVLYVGREALGVLTWNTSACSGSVLRGYLGTQAAPHPSGDMVLIAPVYQTNLAQGGNPVPNGLFNVDPPIGSTCSAGVPTNIWVNVLTGAQWICSTITNTWSPGWNNPLAGDFSVQTTTVPSAAGAVTPSGPLFVISGAAAITGFTIPVGCNATAFGSCSFTVISAAGSTWTWTAAGNIMTAGTGTAGHTFTFTWSASLQKFVPSSLT